MSYLGWYTFSHCFHPALIYVSVLVLYWDYKAICSWIHVCSLAPKQQNTASWDRWRQLVSFLWSQYGSCVLPCLSTWPNKTEFIVGFSTSLYWDPWEFAGWPVQQPQEFSFYLFFFIYTALTLSPAPGTAPQTMNVSYNTEDMIL